MQEGIRELGHLRQSILLYAVAGAFVIAVVSALVAAVPLFEQLHAAAENNLFQSARSSAQSVGEMARGLRQVALQVTSRTRARELLELYNAGRLEPEEYRSQSSRILQDALGISEELAGIVRLDASGQAAVEVGMGIPPELWPEGAAASANVLMNGPLVRQGQLFAVVSAPIGRGTVRVGTDLLLFRLNGLKTTLREPSGLGSSGRRWLLYGAADGLTLLDGPSGAVIDAKAYGLPESAAEWLQLRRQGVQRVASNLVGFVPVDGSPWSLAVEMDDAEVFAGVRRQIGVSAFSVLVLTMLGSVGVFTLVRPLAGGFIMHADSLQQEVDARTAELVSVNEQLRELYTIQNAVLASADNSIIATDLTGRVTLFNEAAEEMLGYSAEETVGKLTPAAFHDPKELTARAEAMSKRLGRPIAPGFEVLMTTAVEGRRERHEWTYVRKDGSRFPVLVGVSALMDEQRELRGFLAIGTDISDLRAARERLEQLAIRDELTGLYNRRHLLDVFNVGMARYRRHGKPMSVLMFDLDHFKAINDTHGHHAGDEVLRQLAEICPQQLRMEDTFGRLGGEEFLALLPETGPEQAVQVAERIRGVVEARNWEVAGNVLRVTVSVGVTHVLHGEEEFEDLLTRVDQALYAAKGGGRNRVCRA